MKVRDSGMPEQEYWESLFNVELILDKMEINQDVNSLVEFGCGYVMVKYFCNTAA